MLTLACPSVPTAKRNAREVEGSGGQDVASTPVFNIKRFSHLIGHKIKSELIKTLE